jgi:2-C-methyl-D-erythritol 4-phosphate cytidylyltransferase
MKVFALIMAGGNGCRMGTDIAKQSIELGGRKIFRITTEKFNAMKFIDGIVFVGRKEDMEEYRKELADIDKVLGIVEGGCTRSDSVFNGLAELEKHSPDIVAVHDAVRPFVEERWVLESINAAHEYGGAVVASPCVDTIAISEEGFVRKVLERDVLRNLQTPQTFRFDILKKAHIKVKEESIPVTDDTGAAIEMGVKVRIIEGSRKNLKITEPADLVTAEQFLKV